MRRRTIRPSSVLWTLLALTVSVVWIIPVYWMLNSSLLPNVILQRTTPTLVPTGGSLDN